MGPQNGVHEESSRPAPSYRGSELAQGHRRNYGWRARPSSCSSANHFGVRLMGPFVEGASVVGCPVVTQDLKDKRRETRARTTPSISVDSCLRCDPFSPQERGEVGGRLERPVVGIEKLLVVQVDGPWQVPEPGRSIPALRRPLELADAAHVPEDGVVTDGGLRLVQTAVNALYRVSRERPRLVDRDIAGNRQPLRCPLGQPAIRVK